eukprot:3554842-Pleurochrysis_carterae.AAC.1
MDYLAFMTKYPAITVESPASTRQISLSVRSSHGTRYLAISRPTGNVVGNWEIRQYPRKFPLSANVTSCPTVTGRVATGWPHLFEIVHPYINILPER